MEVQSMEFDRKVFEFIMKYYELYHIYSFPVVFCQSVFLGLWRDRFLKKTSDYPAPAPFLRGLRSVQRKARKPRGFPRPDRAIIRIVFSVFDAPPALFHPADRCCRSGRTYPSHRNKRHRRDKRSACRSQSTAPQDCRSPKSTDHGAAEGRSPRCAGPVAPGCAGKEKKSA